jgi:aspartate racemase
MGPASTAPFLELVLEECRTQYGARDDADFPKILVCSQPAPFFHDRPLDHAALAAATVDGLRTLERGGADVVGIACNSVHLYFDELRASVAVDLLNIVAVALDALPPGARRVAIAASRPLAADGLYQRAAEARGLVPVDPGWQGEIDDLQEMVKGAHDASAYASKWAEAFGRTAGLAVDAVVVGCLDLTGVLRHGRCPVPLVDAGRALAARLVAEWRRRR